MSMKQQVAECVVAGMTPADIADKLEIDVSYISQLNSDTYFQDILAQLRAASSIARFKTVTKIDNNYDILEETFSTMLAQNAQEVCGVMMSKPGTLNSFMRNLNQMKRRSTGESPDVVQAGTAVLEMPSFMVPEANRVVDVQHNANNEVVQVGDRPLIAMGSEQLAITASENSKEAVAALLANNQETVVPDTLQLLE